ncbi:50S ribosomal protein L13 [Candidatus Woesearchaeota archaeon]|nr:50S ribosomal protein L13 [Candidatus Woesearchaeota archaeon]
MIVDAKDLILGRMATNVAKKALLGESIDIVNCEKAIIVGSKKNIFEKYKIKANRGGPFHGPFLPKMPDRFVRRIIRGMLPYKQYKGREAFKRVMCHISVPNQFKDKKAEKIKDADISRIKTLRYTTVGDVCKFLNGKEW